MKAYSRVVAIMALLSLQGLLVAPANALQIQKGSLVTVDRQFTSINLPSGKIRIAALVNIICFSTVKKVKAVGLRTKAATNKAFPGSEISVVVGMVGDRVHLVVGVVAASNKPDALKDALTHLLEGIAATEECAARVESTTSVARM